jgi:hypothetical protein
MPRRAAQSCAGSKGCHQPNNSEARGAEAKEREREDGKEAGRSRPKKVGPKSGQPNAGRVNSQIAKDLNVGHGTVTPTH